ncbi:hypothetical protein OSB04_019061 [Centaurea solstitialis]|uniref:Reverse transcriptase domain-containing protein n=1 Tax=Centaurea solstitialis TaxID=347529 RepID=A0AA38T930_9ASTR|nr:hypothetical protein OSB04_019061 [Centaurea solstitialis]
MLGRVMAYDSEEIVDFVSSSSSHSCSDEVDNLWRVSENEDLSEFGSSPTKLSEVSEFASPAEKAPGIKEGEKSAVGEKKGNHLNEREASHVDLSSSRERCHEAVGQTKANGIGLNYADVCAIGPGIAESKSRNGEWATEVRPKEVHLINSIQMERAADYPKSTDQQRIKDGDSDNHSMVAESILPFDDGERSLVASMPMSLAELSVNHLRKGFMLKILSWNLNGMGMESKKKWVCDLVVEHKIRFLCLQETKCSIDNDWQVASVWGYNNKEFVALNSSGHSSGLLTEVVVGKYKDGTSELLECRVGCLRRHFNEVRSADERKGSIFDHRGAKWFNDFIIDAGLSDMNLGGRKFTWMNGDYSKLSKLDRFLVNLGFLDLWPSMNAIALSRVLSDHCPILLGSMFGDFGPIPLKFFNSWLSNPELENLVKETWDIQKFEFEVHSKIERLSRKLRFLKVSIKDWKKSTVRIWEKDIDGLKLKITSIELLAELAKGQDELDKNSDENSLYFQGIINGKLRKSKINGLNVNGNCTTDLDKIKDAVGEFFENIFKEEHPIRPCISSPFFKKISDNQQLWLKAPFTNQEVKDAIWSCGQNKALGPDGFSFEFIRKFWSIVGNDFFDAVKFFESNNRINQGSNACSSRWCPNHAISSLAYYRVINLIGCVSKVVSKVLAEHLKQVVGSVIRNTQSTFIKGRSILDGPLMINELISWARKKTFIFKADFAKAFDSLNWNYLDNVLLQMGFGEKWREWVKGCTRTTNVSVLINGSPTKEFNLGKGVRQGDPLAPFLFILATEGLTVVMCEVGISNLFRGVWLDNSEEEVFMLQFADDTIFVGDWSLDNAKNLIRILKCFEACSGLKINMMKSHLSRVSVTNDEVTKMVRRLNYTEERIPFIYLGLPIFLGASEEKKKICWLAWEKVIRDKPFGGLGIGSLHACNLAMLVKWRWLEKTEPDAPWLKVVQSCNSLPSSSASTIVPNGPNSSTWAKICGTEKDLRELGVNISSHMHLGADGNRWEWDLEPNKSFSVRSLRKVINGIALPFANQETEWIRWISNKVSIFLWRALNRRLGTRDNLLRRRVSISTDICPLCSSNQENVDHVLASCSTFKVVNAYMASWINWWPSNANTVEDLWMAVCSSGGGKKDLEVYKVIGVYKGFNATTFCLEIPHLQPYHKTQIVAQSFTVNRGGSFTAGGEESNWRGRKQWGEVVMLLPECGPPELEIVIDLFHGDEREKVLLILCAMGFSGQSSWRGRKWWEEVRIRLPKCGWPDMEVAVELSESDKRGGDGGLGFLRHQKRQNETKKGHR